MHYASSVFEGERAYDGVVFKSREHSERLHKSARILGFEVRYPVEELDKAKIELIRKLGLNVAELRAQAPDKQFEAVAKAMNSFADGAGKTSTVEHLEGFRPAAAGRTRVLPRPRP